MRKAFSSSTLSRPRPIPASTEKREIVFYEVLRLTTLFSKKSCAKRTRRYSFSQHAAPRPGESGHAFPALRTWRRSRVGETLYNEIPAREEGRLGHFGYECALKFRSSCSSEQEKRLSIWPSLKGSGKPRRSATHRFAVALLSAWLDAENENGAHERREIPMGRKRVGRKVPIDVFAIVFRRRRRSMFTMIQIHSMNCHEKDAKARDIHERTCSTHKLPTSRDDFFHRYINRLLCADATNPLRSNTQSAARCYTPCTCYAFNPNIPFPSLRSLLFFRTARSYFRTAVYALAPLSGVFPPPRPTFSAHGTRPVHTVHSAAPPPR